MENRENYTTDTPQEEKSLAIKADSKDLATPQIFGNNGQLQFWTSIPDTGDTRKRAALVSRLMGEADVSAKDLKNKDPMLVENILAHNVNVLVDEKTGEMQEATRVIFQLADGRTVDTVSAGIVSSLRNVFALAGMPPWSPPLKLSIKENDTRRGRRVYSLLISE